MVRIEMADGSEMYVNARAVLCVDQEAGGKVAIRLGHGVTARITGVPITTVAKAIQKEMDRDAE